MFLHERYQTHCRVCSKVLEADTPEAAIRKAMQHEAEMFILAKEGKVHPKTHEEIIRPEASCTTLYAEPAKPGPKG